MPDNPYDYTDTAHRFQQHADDAAAAVNARNTRIGWGCISSSLGALLWVWGWNAAIAEWGNTAFVACLLVHGGAWLAYGLAKLDSNW